MRKDPVNVYWRYVGGLSENPRLDHLKKNNMVLHRDDPWWSTNYPPNGWLCQCRAEAVSEKKAKKRGYEISKSGGESIASKDWAYNVGTASSKELDAYLAKKEKASKLL
jgi:uncharacterized protein with gpF-like domain